MDMSDKAIIAILKYEAYRPDISEVDRYTKFTKMFGKSGIQILHYLRSK